MAMQPGRMLDKSGYLSQDTITALACPTGGAITVIRISGEKAIAGLASLTQTKISLWVERAPRVLYRARVYVQEASTAGSVTRVIDDALVCFFKCPASFTGEDLVELHLHGGSFGASLVLEQLFSLGIRQALPGEFSFRAVRNGKMDISQAQAIADLIAASNGTALEMAVEKLEGAQSRFLATFAESLRRLVTLSEVGIDFSDQDVEEVGLPRLKEQVQGVYQQLKDLEEGYAKGSRIQEGIRVALVGLPNSGKSSFFNALLGEDRSIVSEIAGTTRDVVREQLTIRGRLGSVTLRLEDTAGIRKTEDPIEKIGVERALESARRSDLVLWVIDSQAEWSSIDSLRESLLPYQEKAVIILSKCDLFQSRGHPIGERLSNEGWSRLYSCSIHQAGTIHAAAEGIASFCEKWLRRGEGEILLTRHEQVQAAREAVAHLERALAAQDAALFAADLRHALNSLGPLMGETPTDEILGRIFSNFCIGK